VKHIKARLWRNSITYGTAAIAYGASRQAPAFEVEMQVAAWCWQQLLGAEIFLRRSAGTRAVHAKLTHDHAQSKQDQLHLGQQENSGTNGQRQKQIEARARAWERACVRASGLYRCARVRTHGQFEAHAQVSASAVAQERKCDVCKKNRVKKRKKVLTISMESQCSIILRKRAQVLGRSLARQLTHTCTRKEPNQKLSSPEVAHCYQATK